MQADVDPMMKERLFGAEQTDGMLKQVAKARFLRELRQPTEGEDTDAQSGPSTEPRREPLPIAPVRIGRFAVLRKLGQGGMGVVYAAYDEHLDRKIAIKVLRRALADDERGRVRMLREAQALARLSHPNVVAVHEVGQWRDHDYVAMEFVSGRTLDAWLHERASVRPWREVVSVMMQAGRGLAAAHACELVHRDFKPANVMVGDEGRVRVLDFGLARSVHERDESTPLLELEQTLEHALVSQTSTSTTSAFDRELTATGAVLGTPAYMAPEQHQGDTATPLSDQFSFGVVLFEALYGERPFKGYTRLEYSLRVTEGKIEVPSHSGVPAWLRKLVLRSLAPNPADRWPSMDALLAELGRERGRGFKVGALVAGFAALIVAGLVMTPSEPALCELGDDALVGVWDDEHRAALQQAFASEPHVHETIEARLDRQADALLAARRDACEDRWVRQEQSDAQLALRNQCLDQRSRELRATVARLGSAATSREHAVELLDGLGDVGFCDQVDLLEEGAPAPKDTATAERIASVRDRIADAHALRLASDLPQAWTIVDAIAGEVEQLGYGPLRAELAYLRGRLEQREERVEDARVSLLAAATLSEEFGHLELAPAAWTYLVWVSPSTGAASTSATEVKMAESALRRARISPSDGRRAALEQALAHRLLAVGNASEAIERIDAALVIVGNEATIHRVSSLHLRGGAQAELGRFDAARASYEEAWQLAATLLGPDSLQCADIDFDLGLMLLEQDGLRDEGRSRVERSRGVYVRAGATARVAMSDLALANHALLVGDEDEALRLAQRALEQLPEGNEDRSWALDAIAIIQLNRADGAAAASAVDAAIAHHARLGDSQSIESAFMVMQRGHLRLHQGRVQDAAADFELAAGSYETMAPEHHDWVALWTGRGEVALAEGRVDAAVGAFERAFELLNPSEGDRRLVAHVAWGRARAMAAAGRPSDARRHAETARDILKSSGLEPELEAEIEAFLD